MLSYCISANDSCGLLLVSVTTSCSGAVIRESDCLHMVFLEICTTAEYQDAGLQETLVGSDRSYSSVNSQLKKISLGSGLPVPCSFSEQSVYSAQDPSGDLDPHPTSALVMDLLV